MRQRLLAVRPRRLVIAYAVCGALGWLIGFIWMTGLPRAPYIALDILFDAVLIVGLWKLQRWSWTLALLLTTLGELALVIHPREHAALLLLGAAQIALLMLPQFRLAIASRLDPDHLGDLKTEPG